MSLLDEVRRKGKLFLELPTTEAVLSYRDAISAFLHRAVNRSIKAEHHSSEGSIRKRKQYTLLKIVDEELSQLVSETLQTEANALQLLGRVERIEGLLVNFMG